MRRGELWWAELVEPSGSGPGFPRPVLIISANEFNESKIDTVVCAALTSNLRLAAAPGNLLVKRRDSGLPKDSVVNVSQLLTVDRRFLTERIRPLPLKLMQSVESGLRLALSL